MNGRTLQWLALGLTVAAAAACGGSEPKPAATSTSTAPPAATAAKPAASSSAPRVFFVEPADGATVKSPVKLRFGIENYELAAVPQGDITAARPRAWAITMSASTPSASRRYGHPEGESVGPSRWSADRNGHAADTREAQADTPAWRRHAHDDRGSLFVSITVNVRSSRHVGSSYADELGRFPRGTRIDCSEPGAVPKETRMPGGQIKRLVRDRGFGFIRDDGGQEWFFHRSSVEGNFDQLNEGQRVTFEEEPSAKGPRAGNVRSES